MAGWSAFWAPYPPHFAYVVGAYAVSALGVAGLVIDTLLRAHHWKTKADAGNRTR